MKRFATGQERGLLLCTRCGKISRAFQSPRALCPRCAAPVSFRKPQSLARSSALVLAAAILYLPANLLPVMHTSTIFGDEEDTIMSGVLALLHSGSWPLAALVFFASIFVPMMKLIAMSLLIVSVHRGSSKHTRQRALLFRLVEFIGRWSMLDVYVIALLVALVQIQSLASIRVGAGAFAFGAVVVLTMCAAQSFDERLIWDRQVEDE
jgi:paraquat-inducible protein A